MRGWPSTDPSEVALRPADVPRDLLRRREVIAESMRPPTFKYLTATERDRLFRRLELVDTLIRDHGVIDHSQHEWCDARDGCGTVDRQRDADQGT